MATTVRVELGARSYDIRIGTDVPIGVSASEPGNARALIISDANVDPLYGESCAGRLGQHGIEAARFVVPAGESSKTLALLGELSEHAATCNLDRSSIIVALGGGVVGDLAGFLAATFLRGIRLIQVPTTLLAMVDSAVGGKTGVNLPQGKNLVGAFHQPTEIAADLATLDTLPEREYVSGLAEVVKYGVIRDADLFSTLEQKAAALLARDKSVLEPVIARCCEIKAEVVAADETEAGLRAILNFGHTLAHALEKETGYGDMLHGEAVSVGMVYALRLSVAVNGVAASESDRVSALLRRFGLPVGLKTGGTPWERLRATMTADKKTRSLVPRFVLARTLGDVIIGCEIPNEVLKRVFLEETCRE